MDQIQISALIIEYTIDRGIPQRNERARFMKEMRNTLTFLQTQKGVKGFSMHELVALAGALAALRIHVKKTAPSIKDWESFTNELLLLFIEEVQISSRWLKHHRSPLQRLLHLFQPWTSAKQKLISVVGTPPKKDFFTFVVG